MCIEECVWLWLHLKSLLLNCRNTFLPGWAGCLTVLLQWILELHWRPRVHVQTQGCRCLVRWSWKHTHHGWATWEPCLCDSSASAITPTHLREVRREKVWITSVTLCVTMASWLPEEAIQIPGRETSRSPVSFKYLLKSSTWAQVQITHIDYFEAYRKAIQCHEEMRVNKYSIFTAIFLFLFDVTSYLYFWYF